MLNSIEILKMASAMARHAATRHQVISQNVANADTAGFKAKDLEPFADSYARMSAQQKMAPNSLTGANAWRAETVNIPGVASPNGNTVSVEDQMMRSVEAQQQHEAATAIYRKAMNIMRMSLGRNV